MSPNPYPIFSVSQSDTPEQTQAKINMLVRLYIKDPSPFTSQAIVTHITNLLAYPKYITDIEYRCQLRKMEMHWRCLSWITPPNDYKGTS